MNEQLILIFVSFTLTLILKKVANRRRFESNIFKRWLLNYAVLPYLLLISLCIIGNRINPDVTKFLVIGISGGINAYALICTYISLGIG